MKQKTLFNLLPPIFVFLIISIIWVITGVPNSEIFTLLFGLFFGYLLLDLDHLIYWFWRKPNTDESRIVKTALKKKDFKSFLKVIKAAQTSHANLIFHHYFFQISLNLISFFIFISSTSTLALSILLSINLHLLADENRDYLDNPKFLQKWLFAREEKQLSTKALKIYLIIFNILFFLLLFLLVKSKA